MENLFRPGKWLVLFCGVFVILFATLQYVSNLRLKEEAQLVASKIFTWTWTPLHWQSHYRINDAKVISKNDHDAVVEVSGKQYWSTRGGTAAATTNNPEESNDCTVRLTFYKRSVHDKDYWELGQVLFED